MVISPCNFSHRGKEQGTEQGTEHHGRCPEGSGTQGLGCSRWQCSDGHGSHHGVGSTYPLTGLP